MPEAQVPAAAPESKGTPETKSASAAAPAAAPAAAAAVAEPPPTVTVPPGSRLYEGMFVVDASQGRENYAKILAGIRELLEKSGGTWVNGDKWEERRLAYTIKKRKRGLFILAHFLMPTQALVRLERNLQISELLLRHLITVDVDGLGLVPPSRGLDDDDEGGGERRFFGGDRGDRRRPDRGGRGERGGRPDRFEGRERGPRPDRPPREGRGDSASPRS
jgi:small subunit ribosomal protein S6